MATEPTGRVMAAELQLLVAHVRDLRDRATEHEQTFLAMALDLAAESIADNVEVTMEMDADADAG
jgi:hypothetical protein